MAIRSTFLLAFILGVASATVTTDTKTVTLTDRTLILNCTVTGLDNPTVYWSDPRGVIYSGIPDGQGFGTSRSGPHNRYSYETVGNNRRLIIQRVEPNDDGSFQCIVQRTTENNEEYGSVQVTVYVEPQAISVTGVAPASNEPNNPLTVVTIPYNSIEAKIECSVGPAKPAVGVKWYKAGELMTEGISESITVTDSDGKDTTTSTLTLSQPRKELNAVPYMCRADIEALNLPGILAKPLNQSFSLSVQYPPTAPIITGFSESPILGDVVDLTCQASGGNPFPTLVWYRNDETHQLSYQTNLEEKRVESILTFTISESDNGAVYRCESSNPAQTTPQSAQVRFQVKYPPSKVEITGHQNIRAGDTVTLSCLSTRSNPKANITWFYDGKSLPNTETIFTEDGPGFISQSNISITVNRTDDKKTITCHASHNDHQDTAIDSARLRVLYPPDRLTITGLSNSTVEADTAFRMTCQSFEGSPLPDLKWFRGAEEIDAGEQRTPNAYTRSRSINIVARPQDNEQRYTCKAISSATGSNPVTKSERIAVNFAPQNVTIEPRTPMKAGEPVTLTCRSGSSNPIANITWTKDNVRVIAGVGTPQVKSAAYNGKETVSSYTFTPEASDNGIMVHCQARNYAIAISTTSGHSLSVLHKPIYSGVPGSITLKEGEGGVYNFSAISNPAVTKYTWFKVTGDSKEDLKLKETNVKEKRDADPIPTLTAKDGILTITDINRGLAGNYMVKAKNSEGNAEWSFTIDVEYGAVVTAVRQEEVGQGTLNLICEINANPMNEANNKWTRLEYDMTRTTATQTGSGSRRTLILTINNFVKDDLGDFTCQAENKYGTASKQHTVTPVPFPPVIDKSDRFSKSAAQTSTDGVILCKLESYPKPSVKWFKGEELLAEGGKYKFVDESEGTTHFIFKLTVIGVVENDYGEYKCEVTNSRATDSQIVTLSGTSAPDPPTGLTVENTTDTVIVLSWIPGFDGGLSQQFRIRYHDTSKSPKQTLYADAQSTPFELEGLADNTEYSLMIKAFNALGESAYSEEVITTKTKATPTAKPIVVRPEEPMLIVIMALCVVGGLLLIVTTVLVCIFVRRRRRRKMSEATDSASQSNTVEMYGTHDGYFNEDARSYSTYEKGFDDDYAKHYENENDKNLVKSAPPSVKETYLTDDPIQIIQPPPPQPWSKMEDPHGNYGAYIRRLDDMGSNDNDGYIDELRQLSKQKLQLEGYQRPAFVAGRPPPPPPPGRHPSYIDTPPSIPARNYSPVVDSNPPPQARMYHASLGRSTPSVESTDDMRGHLV